MAKHSRRPTTLPVQQLVILALCRFAEPVALTSVFPYLPEMIESFGIPTDQVAKWAGLTSAVFSLCQFLTGIAWGQASDRFGRKSAILTSLTCTMITTILFGFSQSITWAMIVRGIAGLANGNVGIIRTMVAELVPQKELQPRAFSIMPLVWTIGSIIGPAYGGALVHPAERYPIIFGGSAFLKRFPFALPNLIGGVFFLVGLSSGILFLRESLEAKKDRKDYGLMLGSSLTQSCSKRRSKSQDWRQSGADEIDPLLTENGVAIQAKTAKSYEAPSYRDVFSRQSNINLVAYTFLAMHSVACDQLLPIFMHHPVQPIDSPDVHLPFKFAGGFGINSGRIGLIFSIYGVFGMFIQFFIFPPCARKYGVLNLLKACSIAFPIIYMAIPFTSLLSSAEAKQEMMLFLMLIKGWCAICAFPCSTILLTNSAVSLKILGTLNGVATSISALGRASGPALVGATFTAGLDVGYVITPWWTLAGIGIISAIPVFWLVEMEGFGGDSDSGTSSDKSEDDQTDDESFGESSTATKPKFTQLDLRLNTEQAVFDDDDDDDQVPSTAGASPSPGAIFTKVTSRSTQHHSPRTSMSMRRISSPIGMGEGLERKGSRRYSSNIGASRSGYGAGGTSYY